MNFKDQLKKDLDIFINPKEFADVHQLGNKDVLMVIQEDSFGDKSGLTENFESATQNIYESVKTLFLKASDYRKPLVGERIKLDGEYHYVVASNINGGLLKIVLSSNESYG